VHVVDVSHHNFEDQIRTVNETLKDLGAIDKPMITVFNKMDAYQPLPTHPEDPAAPLSLEEFKQSWMGKNNSPAIFISALKKENVDEFRKLLYDKVIEIHTARYPYDQLLY
jgi:GTP-binding protein HflX